MSTKRTIQSESMFYELAPCEGKEENHLCLQVFYTKGGVDLANKARKRGLWLLARMVELEQGPYGQIEKYALFSGVQACMRETQRFNANGLHALIGEVSVSMYERSGPAWELAKKALEQAGRRLK